MFGSSFSQRLLSRNGLVSGCVSGWSLIVECVNTLEKRGSKGAHYQWDLTSSGPLWSFAFTSEAVCSALKQDGARAAVGLEKRI